MARGARRDLKKEAFWRRVVRGQVGSGLSIRAWCRKHGVQESAFYGWRTRLGRRAAAGPTFAFGPSLTAFLSRSRPSSPFVRRGPSQQTRSRSDNRYRSSAPKPSQEDDASGSWSGRPTAEAPSLPPFNVATGGAPRRAPPEAPGYAALLLVEGACRPCTDRGEPGTLRAGRTPATFGGDQI
jgi:transposase-like protein